MPVLNNVTFCYTKLQTAVKKYEEDHLFQYEVDCIVDEKTAKAFKKQYKKQAPREVDNEDFEAQFKIEPPFPDQDVQYVIKLKKDAQYKEKATGKYKKIPEKVRPRVFVPQEGTKKLKDITFDVLIANGSKGIAQFEENTNKFGTFAHLKAIRVDELIEYKSGPDFGELGEVDELADSKASNDGDDDDIFGGDSVGDDDEAPFSTDDDDDGKF